MQITEILLTGYDGDKPVLAVNLVPDAAAVLLIHTDAAGEAVVDSAWQQPTDTFTTVHVLLDGLMRVPVSATPSS